VEKTAAKKNSRKRKQPAAELKTDEDEDDDDDDEDDEEDAEEVELKPARVSKLKATPTAPAKPPPAAVTSHATQTPAQISPAAPFTYPSAPGPSTLFHYCSRPLLVAEGPLLALFLGGLPALRLGTNDVSVLSGEVEEDDEEVNVDDEDEAAGVGTCLALEVR